MRHHLLALTVGLSAFAASSYGAEIASGYKCVPTGSPEKVIRAMVDRGFSAKQPYDMPDGIPSYAARPGHTAFGFPLVALSGWQDGSDLFPRGPGTAPPTYFAFVVHGNPWEVTVAMRRVGIDLPSRRNRAPAYPYVEVRPFNSEYSEALPPGADNRAAYTLIACHVSV